MVPVSLQTIAGWERFYRANFINSLTGFKSVSLIGTVNEAGVANLAIFSSIVHIGSNPPLIGFINRPLDAKQHTFANIKATGYYSINHLNPSIVAAAHQTSARYPDEVSEFTETGLTPEYTEGFIAPYVKESRLKYSLKLAEIIPIPLNGTFLVIGEVQQVLMDPALTVGDGFIELTKAGSIASNGNDAYYSTSVLKRYERAKPGVPLSEKM